MIHFISDLHFCHKNIIKYCNRPFKNVEEMHQYMIARWNGVVKPEDTVFFLGDFGFMGVAKAKEILDQLNGTKICIMGNHDLSQSQLIRAGFSQVYASMMINIGEFKVKLCHYPYTNWKHKYFSYKRVVQHYISRFFSKKGSKEFKYHDGSINDLKRIVNNWHVKGEEDWLLFGHKHNAVGQINKAIHGINVSADVWNFTPVSEETILDIMRGKDLPIYLRYIKNLAPLSKNHI